MKLANNHNYCADHTDCYKKIQNTKGNKQWEKLKNSLLSVQKEFEERNGRDYCKNCGMNYIFLVAEIERIFLTPSIKKETKCSPPKK